MTAFPAAGPRAKANDQAALRRDADYFAGALIIRLERLARLEGRYRWRVLWNRAAVLARRIRNLTGQALP